MKKISTLLLLAISVFVLGTVSSCKDYEDDLRNDFNLQNATLQAALNAKIAALETALGQIKQCTCDPAIKSDLTALQAKYDALNSTVTGLGTTVGNLNTDLTGLTGTVNNLSGTVTGLGGDVDALKGTVSSLNDCYATLNGQVTTIGGAITTIQGDITGLQTSVANLNNTITSNYNDLSGQIAALQGVVANIVSADGLADKIQNLSTQIDGILTRLGNLETRMAAVEGGVAANGAQITVNTAAIEELKTKLNGINSTLGNFASNADIVRLDGVIATLQAQVDALIANPGTSGVDKDYVDQQLEQAKQTMQAIITQTVTTMIEQNNTTITNNITNFIQTATIEDLNAELARTIVEFRSRIDALEGWKGKLITGAIYQAATNPILLDSYIALPIGVQTNILCGFYGTAPTGGVVFPDSDPSKGDALTDAEIGEAYDLYDGDFYGEAGKVYFTINPASIDFTGQTLRLVNSQNNDGGIELKNVRPSNQLLSFGVSRGGGNNNGFYQADAVLTNYNKARLNTDGLKTAGKAIYNAIKTRSGIKDMAISTMKALNNVTSLPAYALNAPYSWVDANGNVQKDSYTGKYEIAATAVKPLSYAFNLNGVTSKIPHKHLRQIGYLSTTINKHLSKIQTSLDFKISFPNVNLSTDFHSNISITIPEITLDDIKVPLNFTVTGNVTADVDASAKDTVTINKDISYTYEVPMFIFDAERGEYVVQKNADGTIAMETKSGTANINVDVPIEAKVNTTVSGTATVPVDTTVNVPMKEIAAAINEKIIKSMNDQLKSIGGQIDTSVNDMLGQLNKEINDLLTQAADEINGQIKDQLNGIVDDLFDLSNSTNSYIDRINSYIKKVNKVLDKVYGVVDNANHYLQPVMLIGNSGIGLISSSATSATYIKPNTVALYPTSYLAETINPAYKKFVKVTKVWDAQGNLLPESHHAYTLANNSTNKMGVVIDGSNRSVRLAVDSQCVGCTYEIAYCALDYTGYQVAQRYYVKVVK